MSGVSQLARPKFWEDKRLVVIDTETTGLQASARILSIAIYVVENGTTVESWSTLINPGTFIGATHIHGLDATKLANAKAFPVFADKVRGLLTSSPRKTYLTGHNVVFDAARLAYEFRLLGEEPPAMYLLDTKRLAPAVGIGTASSGLAEFAAALGVANPAPHEANADALVTREVILRSIDKLIDQGITDLDIYAVWPSKSSASDDERTYDLEPEHLALHSAALSIPKVRREALGQCLAWQCPELNRRIEDGVTNAATARELLAWAIEQLGDRSLSRYQLGLLADGAVRTMFGRRDLLVNAKPDLMLSNTLELLGAYSKWDQCDSDDKCDRCLVGKEWNCRFLKVPRNAVWSMLYTKYDQVPLDVARKYLFGTQQKPLGVLCSYTKLSKLCGDAALRGAVVAARTMRSLGDGERALVAVRALWKKGWRTPGLTEIYAALEEDNFAGIERVEALRKACAICDEGLAVAGSGWSSWDKVEARRGRLARSIDKVEAKPFANPYNQRPAHPTRFVRP